MVRFECSKCNRTFSRRYNLKRHVEDAHTHIDEMDNGEIEEEMSDTEDHVAEGGGGTDSEGSESETSESEDEEDAEDTEDNFWYRIKMAAWTGDLETKFEIRCQELVQLGLDEVKAARTAAQEMKPFIQENVREIFRDKVEEMKEMRGDIIYKKIMDTKKRIRDEEEDFDEDEAWDYALRKRQFIIDRALGIQKGVNIADFQVSDDDEDATEQD